MAHITKPKLNAAQIVKYIDIFFFFFLLFFKDVPLHLGVSIQLKITFFNFKTNLFIIKSPNNKTNWYFYQISFNFFTFSSMTPQIYLKYMSNLIKIGDSSVPWRIGWKKWKVNINLRGNKKIIRIWMKYGLKILLKRLYF